MTRAGWLVMVLACAAMLGGSLAASRGDVPPGPRPAATPSAAEPVPTPAPDAERLAKLARGGAPVPAQSAALDRYLARRKVSPATREAVHRHTSAGIALFEGRGRSGIGGRAVLPAGTPWPQAGGVPMRFVGAFVLGALPHLAPLPRTGTLALYYNAEFFESDLVDDGRSARVFYLPPGARTSHPEAPESTYPAARTPLRGAVVPIAGDPFLVAAEIEGRPDADALFTAMNDLTATGAYPSHLLGAPVEIQGPVGKAGWVPLAQIEETSDFIIADGGVLHFFIRRSDLRAGRFDRVAAIMESH